MRIEAVGAGAKTSGTAPIFVDPNAKNRIIIIQGANSELLPETLEKHRSRIQQAKLIVLQLEIPLETVYHAIDMGEELGMPILLNPALDIEYVRKCTYFAPNESELGTLTGMPVETVEEIKAAAASLVEKGVRNLIVTMGDKGVLWLTAEKEILIESEKVAAVDTTGAGDSSIGCFAHFITKGCSIEEALQKAKLYAAQTVRKQGTQASYPTRAGFAAY